MNKVLLLIFLLKNITDFFLLIVILHTGGHVCKLSLHYTVQHIYLEE